MTPVEPTTWTQRRLVAEARRLVETVGPSPEGLSDIEALFSDEQRRWHDHWTMAAEALACFAGHDAPAMRAASGPPWTPDDMEDYRALLISAAIRTEVAHRRAGR